MPGVSITTTTSSGPVAPAPIVSGQAFFAGIADKGSTTVATKVRGYNEFVDAYGEVIADSYLANTIRAFFSEGGAQAYIARVVGPDAVAASYTVVDRAGSPVDTITFTAVGPGSYGNDIDITVANGSGSDVVVSVVIDSVTVESVTADTVAGIVAGFASSSYIIATNEASPTAAPNNMPATGTHSLTGGDADTENITSTEYEDALALFIPELGDGFVSIPGVGESVHTLIRDHCEANHRTGCLTLDSTATKSELISAADALNSQYVGLFGPWVTATIDSATVTLPPDGYVAAVRNRAHDSVGPWRAPAGQIAIARFITGITQDWGRADSDALYEAKVNIIRNISSTLRLYGWRSLSDDAVNYSLLSSQDVLNYLNTAFDRNLEQYVFQPIDGKGQLLATINGTLVGILEPIAQANGLYPLIDDAGNQIDPGYSVNTGSTINTLTTLSANEVHAQVGVRLSPTAALIIVSLVKVGLIEGLV